MQPEIRALTMATSIGSDIGDWRNPLVQFMARILCSRPFGQFRRLTATGKKDLPMRVDHATGDYRRLDERAASKASFAQIDP